MGNGICSGSLGGLIGYMQLLSGIKVKNSNKSHKIYYLYLLKSFKIIYQHISITNAYSVNYIFMCILSFYVKQYLSANQLFLRPCKQHLANRKLYAAKSYRNY